MSMARDAGQATETGGGPSGTARVLVAYATKSGSTREIAEAIALTLEARGLAADAQPAAQVRSLAGYQAVVLGSGLYSATWLREANSFVRLHRTALRSRAVWLFSSGPLDRSADFDDIPITPHATEIIGDLPIRGHRTFGGRLLEDAPEVAAGLVTPRRIGDFRDFDAITAWAQEIAAAVA